MRIKRLMKNKKAFSAIIAALILMLIAVAAGVVVYAYVMGQIGGIQTNPPGTGIITIESYTPGNLTAVPQENAVLYIRNHGTTQLNIDAIYVNGTSIEADDITPKALNPSTATTITLVDVELSVGDSVKVVCTDGTTVSQTLV